MYITINNSENTALIDANGLINTQQNTRFCGHAVDTYNENLIRRVNSICCICCDEFLQKDNIALTKCLHVFHIKCLDSFLKNKQECPLCREKITGLTKYLTKQALVNNEAILCDDAACISKTNKIKAKNKQEITAPKNQRSICKTIRIYCAALLSLLMLGGFIAFCVIVVINSDKSLNTTNNSAGKQ